MSTTVAASKKATAKRRKSAKDDYSTQLLLVGDFLCSALWCATSSTFAQTSERLAAYSKIDEFIVSLLVLVTGVMLFGPLCNLFGGALFNPVHNCAMLTTGKNTPLLNITRMALQIGGSLAGGALAVSLLPTWLQEKFPALPGGLKSGVALETGIAAEALLGMVLNFAVLYSMETHRKYVAYWTPIAATVVLIVIGSRLTGPSLNPAWTFAFYYHYSDAHSVLEHLLVYWVAPLAGALLAGLLFKYTYLARKSARPGAAAAPFAARKPAAKRGAGKEL